MMKKAINEIKTPSAIKEYWTPEAELFVRLPHKDSCLADLMATQPPEKQIIPASHRSPWVNRDHPQVILRGCSHMGDQGLGTVTLSSIHVPLGSGTVDIISAGTPLQSINDSIPPSRNDENIHYIVDAVRDCTRRMKGLKVSQKEWDDLQIAWADLAVGLSRMKPTEIDHMPKVSGTGEFLGVTTNVEQRFDDAMKIID
jgi:hypothetical protein